MKHNVLYHGTTDLFLPSILRQGLQFTAKNRWLATNGKDGPLVLSGSGEDQYKDGYWVPEDMGYVFLTNDEERAQDYANLKAEYLRLKPGTRFRRLESLMSTTVVVMGMEMGERDHNEIWKKPDAPYDPHAVGVVLAVNLSDLDSKLISRDPRDDYQALRYKGTIAPNTVHIAWQAAQKVA